jgi:hypothetical protein
VIPKPHAGPSDAERRIHGVLAQPATFNYDYVALGKILQVLSIKYDIPIVAPRKTLDYAEKSFDGKVTLSASNVSLRSALDSMLRDFDLMWTVQDEVLLIVRMETYSTMLVTKVYDVADLAAVYSKDGEVSDSSFESLIETIATSVGRYSWQDDRGKGTIAPFEARGVNVLTITQTPQVHEGIQRLLDSIRRLRSDNAKPPYGAVIRPKKKPNPNPFPTSGGGFGQNAPIGPNHAKGLAASFARPQSGCSTSKHIADAHRHRTTLRRGVTLKSARKGNDRSAFLATVRRVS